MAWFRCFINGEDFPGSLIGESSLVGFYVTRFIEAADADEAETTALQTLREEPLLAAPPSQVPTGQARVFFREIEETTAESVPTRPQGFVWYRMQDSTP